jgi:hypothetical protein
MQGWTADFIPKLTDDAVAMKVIDRILPISGPDAIRCSSKDLATQEGTLSVLLRAGPLLARSRLQPGRRKEQFSACFPTSANAI